MVHPERLMLLMMQRRMSWRGVRRTLHDVSSVPCEGAGGAPPWRAALEALETVLPGYAGGKVAASVTLSNHFVRYALVPWRAELADMEEELSFARHCFTRVYGDSAERWDLRLSHERGSASRLASAADAELLEALRAVFDRAGIALHSIQPNLMAVFNAVRGKLGERSAWFALLEPGTLCLALVHDGTWQRVRSLRIGNAWPLELPMILEREAYQADIPEAPRTVYLWDAGWGATALPQNDTWTFHALNTVPNFDAGPDLRHPASAMAG